jgi:hypothetical protein
MIYAFAMCRGSRREEPGLDVAIVFKRLPDRLAGVNYFPMPESQETLSRADG